MQAVAKESHDGVGPGLFCDKTAQGAADRCTCQHVRSSAPGDEREMTEAAQLGIQRTAEEDAGRGPGRPGPGTASATWSTTSAPASRPPTPPS
jgi:hypothetical protein